MCGCTEMKRQYELRVANAPEQKSLAELSGTFDKVHKRIPYVLPDGAVHFPMGDPPVVSGYAPDESDPSTIVPCHPWCVKRITSVVLEQGNKYTVKNRCLNPESEHYNGLVTLDDCDFCPVRRCCKDVTPADPQASG